MSLTVGFEVSKDYSCLKLALSSFCSVSGVVSQMLFQSPSLPVTLLSSHNGKELLFLWNGKVNIPFLSYIALVMVFNHNNRKVTNTGC